MLGVLIQKNGDWEGDIEGIDSFNIKLPKGLSLNVAEADACSFRKPTLNDDGTTTYEVDPERVKVVEDNTLRFIGIKPLRLDCGMIIDDSFFNGADWAPASFSATGKFLISIKKSGIGVNVIGKVQAAQTPKDLCGKTGGSWDDVNSLCTCKTGAWSDAKGCTAAKTVSA